MNYDQILNKPFLVTSINWTTATPSLTEHWRLPFPSSMMSNPLARVPFTSSTFFQARMCCMLQVSGTPMHQGLILVAAVPHGCPKIVNPNQILSAPHVFLNATESTSVCLECPMYTPSTLYRTNEATASIENYYMSTSVYGSDVFDLVFFVMDSLTVSAGSATSISISVHNLFKEAQFYVPKVGQMSWQAQCGFGSFGFKSKAKVDTKCGCGYRKLSEDPPTLEFKPESFLTNLWRLPTKILDDAATGLKGVTGDIIDYGRGVARTLTGFHNPNDPVISKRQIVTFRNFQNNVDQTNLLEVMDNHAQFSRICDDYYFRTEQDEMDLKFLTSKPAYVGKFHISSTDIAGKNLFAYPMTPMVEASVNASGDGALEYCSPLRTVYESSRAWRGGLKLHIQAVCTNFHFCKIIVLKNYAMTTGAVNANTSLVPAYNNIHNLNTDTLEFSAGGQIQTIDLPYNSNLRQLECTKDYVLNIINHGMVYGYLVQPLTYNSNVPLSITFNVYISGGPDLEFSGYGIDNVSVLPGDPPVYPGVPSFFGDEKGIYEVVDEKHTGRVVSKKESDRSLLQKRKVAFRSSKPEKFLVEAGDTWDDFSFITGKSVSYLRDLNFDKYNTKPNVSKGGFLLNAGDQLFFERNRNPRAIVEEPLQEEFFKTESDEGMFTKDDCGNKALVTPNCQDAVLNHLIPMNENPLMAFRVNTSIRDYVRIMHPQRTLTLAPTTYRNTVPIDLFNLTTTFLESDTLRALTSLYLGLSGGFKLKFKILGVSSASAIFIPPSMYAVNGDYPFIKPMSNTVPSDTNSAINFLTQTTFAPPIKSFTAPQIEIQDLSRPFDGGSSACILEMSIPNMNIFNYVGNASKWFDFPGSNAEDVENDFGVVYINYQAVNDGTNFLPVTIMPFIGLSDEARLGFQTYSPIKQIQSYTTTASIAPATLVRSSAFHPLPIASFYPNGIPLASIPISGASYYFS